MSDYEIVNKNIHCPQCNNDNYCLRKHEHSNEHFCPYCDWKFTTEFYENVAFLQGDEAEMYLDIINESHEEDALTALCEFHYPGEHEVIETADIHKRFGTQDSVFEHENYVMTYCLRIGYIGLYAKLDIE